jgi:hypothetical protein
MLLFFNRFSTRIRFAARKYRSLDHAVDPPVDGVKSHFNYSPLLYYEYWPVFGFRGYNTKFASKKNTTSEL